MKDRMYCKLLKNIEIASGIHKIEIERTIERKNIRPGQFLHIKCGKESNMLLRRPISIAYVDVDRIGLVIQKIGKGTEWLCNSQVGERLDIVGPLGNGFTISPENKKVIVVGGGIGIAPLLELVRQLQEKEVTVLLGYKTHPYLIDEFTKYSNVVKIATEDGCVGHKGYVTDLLKKEIETNHVDMLYTCGPGMMLKEIQKICKQHTIPSQLSIEERMACGIGACLVCSCKRKEREKEIAYVRTCKEGPVFFGDEVILDE